MLKENELATVRYTKGDEVTDRNVIVTYVPTPKHQNVKAIDVSDLSEPEANSLLRSWNAYQEYLVAQRNTLFAFEDFVEHTEGYSPKVKWRTFKPSQLEELE